MVRWFYVLFNLLMEAGAARRDARVRFLIAQVEILRRKLGGNRVIPTPDDRDRLLAIGAELNHEVADIIGIVAPGTYSRWVVDQREGRRSKPVGRPRIARDVCEIVKRLARENLGWGYRRIQGELRKLRLRICKNTVRSMLKAAGLTPSPHRRGKAEETVWRKFIRLHLNTLVACDFFTKTVITPFGMRMAWCVAFIHVGTRKVRVSPATFNPDERWVQQQARNVIMWLDENNMSAEFVVHDRDTKFPQGFDRVFSNAGTKRIRTPVLAPDTNAFAESWIGSIKRECLNHFLCFSIGHLDHIVREYVTFFSRHRPHQGLGNRTLPEALAASPEPPPRTTIAPEEVGRVRCLRVLGGLLRHYEREAA